MKKIAKKIAMIMVILMLANSLTGCFTTWAFNEGSGMGWLVIIPILPALDIVTSPIQLIILIVETAKYAELKNKAKSMDQIDTFSAKTGEIYDAQLSKLKE